MNSSRIDGHWIEEEIAKANFGDVRLNKRFKILASELVLDNNLRLDLLNFSLYQGLEGLRP